MGYRPVVTRPAPKLYPPNRKRPRPKECEDCGWDDKPLRLCYRRWRCTYCADLADLQDPLKRIGAMPNPGKPERR